MGRIYAGMLASSGDETHKDLQFLRLSSKTPMVGSPPYYKVYSFPDVSPFRISYISSSCIFENYVDMNEEFLPDHILFLVGQQVPKKQQILDCLQYAALWFPERFAEINTQDNAQSINNILRVVSTVLRLGALLI